MSKTLSTATILQALKKAVAKAIREHKKAGREIPVAQGKKRRKSEEVKG